MGKLVNCGIWNDRTVSLLSEKTGLSGEVLWGVIEAQDDIELSEVLSTADAEPIWQEHERATKLI